MSEITASMVKELRETSGAGMMDCKPPCKNAMAIWLLPLTGCAQKAWPKRPKKPGRVAADGLVGVASEGTAGAVVEVNSETDFVARNETFQSMVGDIATVALGTDNHDGLLAADYPGAGKSVEAHVTEMVGTIGENMTVRRSEKLSVENGVVASYIHNQVVDGLGKSVFWWRLSQPAIRPSWKRLDVSLPCMWRRPIRWLQRLMTSTLPRRSASAPFWWPKQKKAASLTKSSKKMVEGRLRKFYEEVVLTSQTFVIDGETRH